MSTPDPPDVPAPAEPLLAVRGAVLTATEVDGCAPAADWARWIESGRAPVSGRGAGFADNAADDLAQLAGLGTNEVVLTLEWARLEPTPGRIDPSAVETVRSHLEAARAAGLAVWACLVDGTLPGWFADDQGGFADDRSRSLVWPRHVDAMGELFGDLVDGWVPQREPALWAVRRELWGSAPPGRRDPRGAATAVRDALLADGEAWRLLRGTAPVATYQTVRLVVPSADDVKARPRARFLDQLLHEAWIVAATEGVLAVGDLATREVPGLRGAYDRVVAGLRPAVRVDGTGGRHPYPDGRAPGPTGLVAEPDLLIEALDRVAGRVDQPVVAAADLADVTDDGRARPDHIRALVRGAAAVSGVVGWWQVSPIDGYRWDRGFSLHPGVIDRNRDETPAADALRLVLANQD